MLLQLYLQLNDSEKTLLADVFANKNFFELVQQAYLQQQLMMQNLQGDDLDPAAFQLMYKKAQQKLEDIHDLYKFMQEGREEFVDLINAMNATQPEEQKGLN